VTIRAITIALLGALFISSLAFFNDTYLGLEKFNSGQYLPLIVFGSLIVGLLTVNPLLHRIRRRFAFSPAELAVIVGMLLVVVGIPGRGVCETFGHVMVMPAEIYKDRVGWRKNDLLRYVPADVYPAEGKYDPEVQGGFKHALAPPEQFFGTGIQVVPWRQWRKPLTTWIPLILLMGGCSICLAVIVHRQWSSHEHLRYPIAEFAGSLLDRDESSALGAIFKSRAFWVAFGILVFFRGVNYVNTSWLDGRGIAIPWRFDLPIWPKMTYFHCLGFKGWYLTSWRIYPVVIAFSFFLASDISLTFGVGHWLYCIVMAVMVHAGVTLNDDLAMSGVERWGHAGAYLGLMLLLLYCGRHYYRDVLSGAVTPRRTGKADLRAAVWACRLLLLCGAGLVVLIARMGMPWPFSILVVALILITFIGISRISAETGLFFIRPGWTVMGTMLGLLGFRALGPTGVFLAGLIPLVLCYDATMCLMPYMVHVFRICQGRAKLTAGRVGAMSAGFYVIGTVVAVVAMLYVCYNFQSTNSAFWGDFTDAHVWPMQALDNAVTDLGLKGELEESQALAPMERLGSVQMRPSFAWSAGAGLLLVVIVAWLRLRFGWWPIHPVLFLVWGTWPAMAYWSPFLLGWMIKSAVTRFGGTRAYKRAKRFMTGVIAGEVVTGLLFIIIGFAYRLATHTSLPYYSVWPR